MPAEVEAKDDFGLCQKIRNLEFLGFSQEEILENAFASKWDQLFQNCLYLAHHKRMSANTAPWQLNRNTGKVFSYSVLEELESYVERRGKIERMPYALPIGEEGAKVLGGLKLAITDARKNNEDLTLEAVNIYFMTEDMAGEDFRNHVRRYDLARSEEEINLALDRVDRFNLF